MCGAPCGSLAYEEPLMKRAPPWPDLPSLLMARLKRTCCTSLICFLTILGERAALLSFVRCHIHRCSSTFPAEDCSAPLRRRVAIQLTVKEVHGPFGINRPTTLRHTARKLHVVQVESGSCADSE